MTSQFTADFVARFFAAMDQHDESALLDLVHPDVEFTSLILEVEGRFRGHEGVRRYLGELYAAFPEWRVRVEAVREVANAAVVKVRVRASPAGGRSPIDLVDWQTLTMREGKAASWAFFRTEAEAVEAAALPR